MSHDSWRTVDPGLMHPTDCPPEALPLLNYAGKGGNQRRGGLDTEGQQTRTGGEHAETLRTEISWGLEVGARVEGGGTQRGQHTGARLQGLYSQKSPPSAGPGLGQLPPDLDYLPPLPTSSALLNCAGIFFLTTESCASAGPAALRPTDVPSGVRETP